MATISSVSVDQCVVLLHFYRPLTLTRRDKTFRLQIWRLRGFTWLQFEKLSWIVAVDDTNQSRKTVRSLSYSAWEYVKYL